MAQNYPLPDDPALDAYADANPRWFSQRCKESNETLAAEQEDPEPFCEFTGPMPAD